MRLSLYTHNCSHLHCSLLYEGQSLESYNVGQVLQYNACNTTQLDQLLFLKCEYTMATHRCQIRLKTHTYNIYKYFSIY